MLCSCAVKADEFHDWECESTCKQCHFLIPNAKACAMVFNEGPDANKEREDEN